MDTCLTMKFPTTANLLSDRHKIAKQFAKAIQGALGDSYIPPMLRTTKSDLPDYFVLQLTPAGSAPKLKYDYQNGTWKFSLTADLDGKWLEITVSEGKLMPSYEQISDLQDKIREVTDADTIRFYEGYLHSENEPIEDLREWIEQKRTSQ